MNRAQIGTTLFFLSILIYGLHAVALDQKLYFFHPLLDIPMHFLGGLVTAFLFLFIYLFITQERKKEWHSWEAVAVIMLGTFAISLLWEVFEYQVGISPTLLSLDTYKDLTLDTLGALTLLGCTLYNRHRAAKQAPAASGMEAGTYHNS